jgi:hypothetical protein
MRYVLVTLTVLANHAIAFAQGDVSSDGKSPCDEDPTSLACLLTPDPQRPRVGPFDGAVPGIILKPGNGGGIINNEADPRTDEAVPDFVPRDDVNIPNRAAPINRQFQDGLVPLR